MEPKNATVAFRAIQPATPKEKRPYGKAPLELDLPGALDALSMISKEGRSLPESKLAIVLGNTVTSSSFTRKVRALGSYGLLTQNAGQFALTELALAIAFPRSPQSQTEAKKQAFLKIEQFGFLFNQHKGKLLPADEFLRNILEHESDIPRDVSEAWVKQFKDGAKAAGLFHDRGDGKIQIVESPMAVDAPPPQTPPPQQAVELEPQAHLDGNGSQTLGAVRPAEYSRVVPMAASGHCTRIDLSDGRRAEIIIPDRLSARDAQKLQKALDGVRVIIESMILEDQKP